MKKVFFLCLLVLTLCQITLLYGSEKQGGGDASLFNRAPNIQQRTLVNQPFDLYRLLKKGPVLINFWATWCGPCILEMKDLIGFDKDPRLKDVQTVSISIDGSGQKALVKRTVRRHGFPFIILHDPNKEIYRQFNAQAVPYTVLINQKGDMVYRHSGYTKQSMGALKHVIQSL